MIESTAPTVCCSSCWFVSDQCVDGKNRTRFVTTSSLGHAMPCLVPLKCIRFHVQVPSCDLWMQHQSGRLSRKVLQRAELQLSTLTSPAWVLLIFSAEIVNRNMQSQTIGVKLIRQWNLHPGIYYMDMHVAHLWDKKLVTVTIFAGIWWGSERSLACRIETS